MVHGTIICKKNPTLNITGSNLKSASVVPDVFHVIASGVVLQISYRGRCCPTAPQKQGAARSS